MQEGTLSVLSEGVGFQGIEGPAWGSIRVGFRDLRVTKQFHKLEAHCARRTRLMENTVGVISSARFRGLHCTLQPLGTHSKYAPHWSRPFHLSPP